MVSTSLIFDAAEQDPEVPLKLVETSIRNIYANGVARGGGSIFSHGKGRESAMMASSGFWGSCGFCYKPGHKAPVFIFFVRVWRVIITFARCGKHCCYSSHQTDLHDDADYHAQRQQCGNGGGGGITRETTTAATVASAQTRR